MNGPIDAERILDAYLAPEADRLPDRVIDAALADIARTRQRRALRVPWRFPLMPALSRTASVAAVVLVVAVGAGALVYLNSPGGGVGGSGGSSTPIPSAAPTPTPAPAATPAPSEIAPGITGFTRYTSRVYGLTFGYPDGWSLGAAATRKWQEGDQLLSEAPNSDWFENPAGRDGDDIAFAVLQRPAGSGADVTSREGLTRWFQANSCDDQTDACETVPDVAVPMCVGKAACLPAILVPLSDSTQAVFADAETGLVTIVSLGRPDDLPAAARYGGGVQLLKSILTTMDVWAPAPGQLPS
jgi:hypothetical protein